MRKFSKQFLMIALATALSLQMLQLPHQVDAWDADELTIALSASQFHPIPLPGPVREVAIGTGGNGHVMVILEDGSLWGWGNNERGQLGIGESGFTIDEEGFGRPTGAPMRRDTPMRVGTEYTWTSVEAHFRATTAIKEDGSLWAWGNVPWGVHPNHIWNAYRNEPTQFDCQDTRAATWTHIAAHQLMRDDGSLWSWGGNLGGGLGAGDAGWFVYAAPNPIPVAVPPGVTSWQSFGPLSAICCCSGLWTWGNNGAGAIGDGTTVSRNRPTRVIDPPGVTGWSSVVVGGSHRAAICSDGRLWTWGNNGSGRLGVGAIGRLSTRPMLVGAETDRWISVAASNASTLALMEDGSLWTWGSNITRQPQVNTNNWDRNNSRNTPLMIDDSGTWRTLVSSGGATAAGIRHDGSLVIWGFDVLFHSGDIYTHSNIDDIEQDSGFRLNLTNERIEVRNADGVFEQFTVRSFSLNGRNWRNTSSQDFHTRVLPGLLNRRITNLRVSDTLNGYARGIRVEFENIEARPRTRLTVNYAATGTSLSADAPHGRWALTTRATRHVQAEEVDYSQFVVASATHVVDGRVRNIRANAVTERYVMASVTDIRYVQPIGESNRVVRTRYFVQSKSTTVLCDDGEPTFTPMSRPLRITASSALRAPNIRPHAANNTLSIRRGVMLYYPAALAYTNVTGLPQGTTDLAGRPVFAENGVITNPSAAALEGLRFRTAATERRPASMPTEAVTIQGNPNPGG